MNIVIERMRMEHLDSVALLEQACFSTPWTRAMLEEELANEHTLLLTATDGAAEVYGYVGMQAVLDEGYILNVAVAPAWRRCGIARRLVARLIEKAQEMGLSFLTLEVRAGNEAAIALYRGEGFAPVGQRKKYYSAPTEDALLMTRYFQQGTVKP